MPTDFESISHSALFDNDYYASQLSDKVPVSKLIEHFITTGASNRLSPHPLFQSRFYLEKYPDVASAGINPLIHYIAHGAFEGRFPNPYFDSKFYLRNFPDLERSRSNPLTHYLACPVHLKSATHPLFDPQFYLSCYPEVLILEEDPLVHYLRLGQAQKRKSFIEFDPDFYLRTYLDVANAGLDAVEHFRLYGRSEGRLPRARSLAAKNEALLKNMIKSSGDTTAKICAAHSAKTTPETKNSAPENGEKSTTMQIYWGCSVYEPERLKQLMNIAHHLPEFDFYVHKSFRVHSEQLAPNIKCFETDSLLLSTSVEAVPGCRVFVNPLESPPLSEFLLMAIRHELLVICSDACELSAFLTPAEASFIPDGMNEDKIVHGLIYAGANRADMNYRAVAAHRKIFD